MEKEQHQPAEAPQTAQQPMTPDQAFARVLMRQRDNALNSVAQLEVEKAQLMGINDDLGRRAAALQEEVEKLRAALAERVASDPIIKRSRR